MGKGLILAGLILFVIILFVFSVSALDIKDAKLKITHYAEEYETGNINYAKMIVYLAAVNREMDEILHTRNNGQVVGASEIEAVLGPSTEDTGWAWSNEKQGEVKLDQRAPGWRKTIFDGNKIQIILEAWPQLFEKKSGEKILYYNFHMNINFKDTSQEDLELDVGGVTSIVQSYKDNPTDENSRAAAEYMVEVEKPVQSYLQENSNRCEAIMNDLIGSQYSGGEYETTVNEIRIKDDDIQQVIRIEYCEACANPRIWLDAWHWERGGYGGDERAPDNFERYKGWSEEQIKQEFLQQFNRYLSAGKGELGSIESSLRSLNQEWLYGELANKEIQAEMEQWKKARTGEWTNADGEAEKKEWDRLWKAAQAQKITRIKGFYDNLFSSYPSKIYTYKQIDYERRLIDLEQQIEFLPPTHNQTNQTNLINQTLSNCPTYPAAECNGTLIFSGNDGKGCPLPPICILQSVSCNLDSDCAQPLCGAAACIEGTCQVTQLTECREAECVPGEEQRINCASGQQLVTSICVDGLWNPTGQECESSGEVEIVQESDIVAGSCTMRADCGENEVCSSGQCVVLPEIVEEPEDIPELIETKGEETETPSDETDTETGSELEDSSSAETDSEEASSEASSGAGVTGGMITLLRRITGFVISGFVESNDSANSGNSDSGGSGSDIESGSNDTNRGLGDGDKSNESVISNETGSEEPEQNIDGGQDDEDQDDNIGKREDKNENFQNNGALVLSGSCRVSAERAESWINFNVWGFFEKIQKMKEKEYKRDNSDWCKRELNSLIMQRKELEKSLDSEFARWFFEEYLSNAANDWEQRSSGIYELYWKDVELSRRIASSSSCAGVEMPEFKMINFSYETDYGSVEFWEEMKEANLNEIGWGPEKEGRVELISPYMMIWIFPAKEFVKVEMQKAMKEGRFPGDRKDIEEEDGIVFEEKDRENMKSLESLMEKFESFILKYGQEGRAEVNVQLVDYADSSVVFNLYAIFDNEKLLQMQPMSPEQMPATDVQIQFDFDKVYNMIEDIQKDMKEVDAQTPPWDRGFEPVNKVQQAYNIAKMWLKFQGLISSATVTPPEAENDLKDMIKTFIWEALKHSGDRDDERITEKDQPATNSTATASITGEFVRVL